MDLSKMLNADEAGDKSMERPRLERAHTDQSPPAYFENKISPQPFTSHDSSSPANRSQPLPPVQTGFYNPQNHQNASSKTARPHPSYHQGHFPQFASAQTSYHQGPQTAPLKASSPYTEGQYPFPRQLDYAQTSGSRNPSTISGGSLAGPPMSPSGYNHSPATPKQHELATPNKTMSMEYRPPSHASTGSSHSHPAAGHLDSPLSVRSVSQPHLSQGSQQNIHQLPLQQSPHPGGGPMQYALGHPSQQFSQPGPPVSQPSYHAGSSRPPMPDQHYPGYGSQDSQKSVEQHQAASGASFQHSHVGPMSSLNQSSPQVMQSPDSYYAPLSGPSPQIARVTGSLTRERERSVSISPKTVVSTLPRKRSSVREFTPPRNIHTNSQMSPPSRLSLTSSPSQPTRTLSNEVNMISDVQPSSSRTSQQAMPEESKYTADLPQAGKRRLEEDHPTESHQTRPPAKKARYQQPPIWARNAKSTTPLPVKKGGARDNPVQIASDSAKSSPAANGHLQPVLQPDYNGDGPLGPWEKSIFNFEPHEEVTKAISDFLFQTVVERDDLTAGGTGDDAPFKGQIEIEAKIGTLVDNHTKERMRLPIQTESVLLEGGVDVSFESTMTEAQHKVFNQTLNEAVKESRTPPMWIDREKPPPKPRIPIHYVHTREKDSFYELPTSELSNIPLAVKKFMNPARTPRLRVTTDSKTGNVLAKIIKVRLFDLHVYSPRTVFDWRVSVSFEMAWEGDLAAFVDAIGPSTAHPDRNKDRMSYKQLEFQIDLTQVKQSGTGKNVTHELEIEMAVPTVISQGKAAKNGEPNQYMDLVKTFADNVRVLIRRANGG